MFKFLGNRDLSHAKKGKKLFAKDDGLRNSKTVFFYKVKRRPKLSGLNKFGHKKKSSRKILYIFYSFLVIFVSLLGIFLISLVPLNKITCETEKSEPCSQDIIQVLSKHENSKLYSSYALISADLNKEPSIDNFSINFDLLNLGWNVKVFPKKASYAIKNKNSEILSILSEDGNVISITDKDLLLPTLLIDLDLPVKGAVLDKSVIFALSIIKDIKFMYNIDYGTLTPDGLVIEVDSKKRLLFPLEGDREVLVGGAMYVLGRLNNKSSITKQEKNLLESGIVIDMRFDNPVLRPLN